EPRQKPLGAQQTHVLAETVSWAGHAVRLAVAHNNYRGAKPYFVVTTSSSDRATRYTPFRKRAETIFQKFLADVTDPQALAERPMPPFDAYRDVVEHEACPVCATEAARVCD